MDPQLNSELQIFSAIGKVRFNSECSSPFFYQQVQCVAVMLKYSMGY